MQKKTSLPYISPFDIGAVKKELKNYNAEKVKQFIRRADMIMSVDKRLNHANPKGIVRKDLKANLKKFQKMCEYIYSLHNATIFKQIYFKQTYGKEAVKAMDIMMTGIDYIEEALRAVRNLITFLEHCNDELKTKRGRSTADESHVVTGIAGAYRKYIDEPRQQGGHFQNVLCLIFNDPKGTERTKAIREARKRLGLSNKKVAKCVRE